MILGCLNASRMVCFWGNCFFTRSTGFAAVQYSFRIGFRKQWNRAYDQEQKQQRLCSQHARDLFATGFGGGLGWQLYVASNALTHRFLPSCESIVMLANLRVDHIGDSDGNGLA